MATNSESAELEPKDLEPINPLERDCTYFLELVTFEVEGHLFQVPTYHFARNTDFLKAIFSHPEPTRSDLERSSENTPLKLAGVCKEDFQKLLEVMYPLNSTTLWTTKTKQSWISVLNLATKWNFNDFRALALEKLSEESLDPIEKVLLARAYRIPQWLRTGYYMLVTQSEPLSVPEAKEIGYPIAIHLCQIREQIQVFSRGYYPLSVGNAYEAVDKEFREELREMEMVYDAIGDSSPTTALKDVDDESEGTGRSPFSKRFPVVNKKKKGKRKGRS